MPFSLKFQRNNQKNGSAMNLLRGKLEKRLYFHRAVEIKQPHTMTEPRKTFSDMEPPKKTERGYPLGLNTLMMLAYGEGNS